MGIDHLFVHKACCQARASVETWFYREFPACTNRFLSPLRMLVLHSSMQLEKVDFKTGRAVVERRKEAARAYESRLTATFGSRAHMEALYDKHPNEQYLTLNAQAAPGFDEESLAVAPKRGLSQSSSSKLLFIDACLSFTALFFVIHYITGNWDSFSVHSVQLAYTVIACCIMRTVFLAFAVKTDLCLVCILTMCFIASALGTTAWTSFDFQQKSHYKDLIALCTYYTMQICLSLIEAVFCCQEASVAPPVSHDSPLDILLVTDYMPPQTHGIATHSDGLVTALREDGHTVDVYTTCGEVGPELHHNWAVTNIWNPDVALALWPNTRMLYSIITRRYDVIHIIFPSLIVWPILVAARIMGRTTLCSHHCREDIGKAYVPKYVLPIVLPIHALISTIPSYLLATVNGALTHGFIAAHPFFKHLATKRTSTVPSSIDHRLFRRDTIDRAEARRELCARFNISEGATIWLVVSRLAPEKDIHELIDALVEHRRVWPEEDVHLVVAGDGPSRPDLERRAEGLPAHFMGMCAHRLTPRLYVAADVCITCSTAETFGLTVLEAMACGVPKVMPHCATFDELYADVLSDWMYVKRDARSLAEAAHRASQSEARSFLAELHERSAFGPDIFWSWSAAAQEQCLQYRRASLVMHESRRQVRNVFRTILATLSIVVALLVLIRSIGPAAKDVWYGIAVS
eukprot:NODE_1279_length_2537_cov_15.414108.p1 GENE.NODE_1279_length_2537_cov_15.414108~~NODE_1279_length_2537_cov_15.414108.p1  ORF type:complete len:731 (-),score=184.37 NODE_1279_length_2537_cov_15.414108:345-2411(-)